MWTVPFTIDDIPLTLAVYTIKLPPKIACNVYAQKSTTNLITNHHITWGSIAPPTLIQVIKNGYLTTFPGLTVQAVQKYLQKSFPYYMSHINKIRKNTRSTKKETIKESMKPPTPTLMPFLHCNKLKREFIQLWYNPSTSTILLP